MRWGDRGGTREHQWSHGLYYQFKIQEYTWAFLFRYTLPLTQAQLDACPGSSPNPSSGDTGAGSSGSDSAAAGDPGAGSSGGGGGGSCFIATATYGSFLDPHVAILKEFRDKHLLTNAPGRRFVRLYRRYSPRMASLIEGHKLLKAASRGILTPLVYAVEYPYEALVALFFASGAILVIARRR